MIAGLEIILHANGHPRELGTGVAAVQEVYAEAAVAAARKSVIAWHGYRHVLPNRTL